MSHFITPAMLKEAQSHGMSVTQAARHFGVPRNTLDGYARRRGIQLPKEKPGIATDAAASDRRVLSWSCRPSAIAKALEAATAKRAAKVKGQPQ